jgi:hypothetical protein
MPYPLGSPLSPMLWQTLLRVPTCMLPLRTFRTRGSLLKLRRAATSSNGTGSALCACRPGRGLVLRGLPTFWTLPFGTTPADLISVQPMSGRFANVAMLAFALNLRLSASRFRDFPCARLILDTWTQPGQYWGCLTCAATTVGHSTGDSGSCLPPSSGVLERCLIGYFFLPILVSAFKPKSYVCDTEVYRESR